MRQLGLGVRLFQQDHDEMFPPAALHGQNFQLSWDSFIHPYIGGSGRARLSNGVLDPKDTPTNLRCPADLQPKVDWMGGDSPWFGIRSYAMVGVGPTWSTQVQVNTADKTYPLPSIALGVGIYWFDESLPSPDWDAKSYKASVVRDPAGTLPAV